MEPPPPSPNLETPLDIGASKATRLVTVLAPAPDFLAPLEGESAMLLHLLGQAFTDLIEGA